MAEKPIPEMVERVAKAIAEALAALPEPDSDKRLWLTLSGQRNGTFDCGAITRAAIAAMREPTKGMVASADKPLHDAMDHINGGWTERIWQAMIDAAGE